MYVLIAILESGVLKRFEHNKLATRIFYVSILSAPRLTWIKIDSFELVSKNGDEQRDHRVDEKAARPATNATALQQEQMQQQRKQNETQMEAILKSLQLIASSNENSNEASERPANADVSQTAYAVPKFAAFDLGL